MIDDGTEVRKPRRARNPSQSKTKPKMAAKSERKWVLARENPLGASKILMVPLFIKVTHTG